MRKASGNSLDNKGSGAHRKQDLHWRGTQVCWGARLRGRTLRGGVLGTFWKPPSQNPFSEPFFAVKLQSHPPVTGVLKWEIPEVLWEVLPRVLPEIGVLQGVLPRVLTEIGGAPGSAPESAHCGASTGRALSGALPGAPPISVSTLGSTPWSTPISGSTLGSTSQSTSGDFPL